MILHVHAREAALLCEDSGRFSLSRGRYGEVDFGKHKHWNETVFTADFADYGITQMGFWGQTPEGCEHPFVIRRIKKG